MADNVWDIIIATANKYAVDPFVAVADAIQESRGNPNAIGDSGDSVGLFQLNIHGEGAGMTVAARENPGTNADIALHQFQRVAQSGFHGSGGQLAAAAERPRYPAPYATSVDQYIMQLHSLTATGMTLNNAAVAVSRNPASAKGLENLAPMPGLPAAKGSPGDVGAAPAGVTSATTTTISNPLDYLNPANFTRALTQGATGDFLIRAGFIITGLVLVILGVSIAFKVTGLATKAAATVA